MARTLVKEKPIKKVFMDELFGVVATPISPTRKKEIDTSIWIEKPVDVQTFCIKYCGESLFPLQHEFCEAMTGTVATQFSTQFDEGHAFWGKGCITGETLLRNELDGKDYTIKELAEEGKSISIKSYDTLEHKVKTCETGVPFSKGNAKLYKVKTKAGKEIIVSDQHMFYSNGEWLPLSSLNVGDKIMINNTEKERLRREKISKTLSGRKKSQEHKKNIKNSNNPGRFKKGHKPEWTGSNMTPEQIQSIKDKLTGKKLSKETRQKMSAANLGLKHHKSDCPCLFCKTKRGEYKVFRKKEFQHNGMTMRSAWEVKFAQHLDRQEIPYEYEPKSFLLSDGTRYIPDFYLPSEDLWIEIKGRLERKSEDKMELFVKEYGLNFLMLRYSDLKEMGVL
jgi:intein/homing endonuclease